jgi:hypothetical protein
MSGVARGALWTMVALAAFFAADSLLFRTGWYTSHLLPDSSAGTLESQLHWLQNTPRSGLPEVLVVGDSRIAEGFSVRDADSAVDRRLHFWNFGMPGTTPRVWYYALRAADPTRRRFAAIVMALDKYSDADWFGLSEDRISDQNFVVMQLGLSDCADFAASLNAMALRQRALFGCLFRGVVLRPDVQDFLAHPKTRLERSKDWRNNGLGYITDYGGKPESLQGLTADWTNRTIHFPDGVSDAIRANVTQFVLPEEVPKTGALARYRQRWLGGILDMYKDSPTRIVFLQLPRGPLVNPRTHNGPGFVDSASKLPRVSVLPADTFTDLERPELFADGLHLNREGRPIFSQRLAQRVDAIVSGGGR